LQEESRWFLEFLGLGDQQTTFCAAVSTVNYRDMGHGMGQRISCKISPNFLAQNIKEKFRNLGGFGTFMVAEAGLEPTTSGL
jgi:hypothetical protein